MGIDHIGKFNVNQNLQFTKGIRLLDDCEGTFNWVVVGTGSDYSATFETAAAMIGTKGMHVKTRATSPAENDTIQVNRQFGVSESGLLAMRGNFNFVDQSLIASISMFLHYYDGTDKLNGKVVFTPQTPLIQWLNSAGGFTAFTEAPFKVNNDVWFQMELVIDTVGKIYKSARVGQLREDLDGEALRDSGGSTYTQVLAGFILQTDGAAQAQVYADQFYMGEYENL